MDRAMESEPNRPTKAHAERTRTLADLARKTEAELEALYRAADVDATFFERAGRPRGRMLAVRKLADGRPFDVLRGFAAHRAFPWGGKSFFRTSRAERLHNDSAEGRGINRVRLGAGRFEWFPFDTRIAKSLVDGRDTVALDYDKPENPFFIRKIHDEIREIERGLFLGPAMWKTASGAAHVLWFALDFEDEEPEG